MKRARNAPGDGRLAQRTKKNNPEPMEPARERVVVLFG